MLKKQSLKKQAALITLSGALVRAMGFLIRLWVSRMLGAEAMGIVEMASGVHALALTPAAAGLPAAVSRLTARAESEEQRQRILYAGRQIARRVSLWIMPVLFFLSPLIARALGDERTLPSLLFFAPCVLFIGLSGVYDGYCLGKSSALPPVMSELGEQGIRFLTLLLLSFLISRVTPAWRAALPAAAGLLGEGAGWLIAVLMAGRGASFRGDPGLWEVRRELWTLSVPLILNRLCHTGLRMLSSLMIPRQLAAAGLPHGEAMSRLGMLNGMVMPLMFLPGLLAGSLAVVGGPAAARCASEKRLRRLFFRMLLPALFAGMACAGGLYLFAPLIARKLYRLPELTGLIRLMCPMAVLLPTQQALGGMMNGLGWQKQALRHGLLGAAATLLFTWLWTARMGIPGAGRAAMLGHGLTLAATLGTLIHRLWIAPGGKGDGQGLFSRSPR